MLIRPRLTDYHGISSTQAELDFAIPFLDEDLPLYVDPFLLWRSPSQQDQALHTTVTNSFNHLNHLIHQDRSREAVDILVAASECAEIGLGHSKKRKGSRISHDIANDILSLFRDIPEYDKHGFTHFEEIQLYVRNISKDRISDICTSFLKSFLIDYTIQECDELGVPTSDVTLDNMYDYRRNAFVGNHRVRLPVNPDTGAPILFVPKRWLRFSPWINFDDYFRRMLNS